MAKIKINKLPKGFKLVDGKVVEDKFMRDGGDLQTGDQSNYGLVSTPQDYYSNNNFNDSDDVSVRYSLSGVPRENANIEAEGGETVLTDLTDDGTFGLYNITGPRHSKGGVPMFLPEQSFIYSDTDKMKFTSDELSEFGINSKKKMTPAKLSKKYQLNEHYANLQSPYADKIQSTTAELMLKKNMMNLSKAAFGQESKKKFEDGVPLASHPYLVQQGIDPIEFTAKMEEITIQEAQMKAMAAMPPEQQEQMLQMQQMMAQMEQQQASQQPQGQQQQMPEQGVEMDSAILARFGGERTLRKAQTGTGNTGSTDDDVEFKNPGVSDAQWAKWLPELKKGATIEYTTLPDGSTKATINATPITSRNQTDRRQAGDLKGSGSRAIYNEDITGQDEAFLENGDYFNDTGLFSKDRPLRQNETSIKGTYGSEDIQTPEARLDLERRWGSAMKKYEADSGKTWSWDMPYEQTKAFQKNIEIERKADALAAGVPYIPYFIGEKDEGFDGLYGLHTFNAPKLTKTESFSDEAIYGEKTIPIKTPDVYTQPKPEFWIQDQNNLMALGQIDDNLYLPWAPDAENINVAPTFDDWRAQVNSNNASASTMANALGAVGGPQAVANSNIQGRTLDANAKAINRVNSNNVNIANQSSAMQAQYDDRINTENARRQTKVYDDTQKTLQAHDNFKNWKVGENVKLQNAALTNRANTYNLNSTFDNMAIDPTTGGIIGMTNPRGLEKVGNPVDRSEQFWNRLSDFQRKSGTAEFDKGMWDAYNQDVYGIKRNSNQNKYQQESAANAGRTGRAKTGKEVRRMVVPFYTGKMGG
jgi:hypothetical protein